MHQNSIIVICGPTAVGKTAVAIRLAQQLNTQIISADSRQCFKELNIGVAKPSVAELESVHHYFINSHSITQDVNAGVFENYALAASEEIFAHHPVAIMVGGTGLYIKAFTQGMDEMPVVAPAIREQIKQSYQQYGLPFLQAQVAAKDPAFWQIAEQQNPQRLMRALEVVLSSGKSVMAFRQEKRENRPFNIIKIGLEVDRQQLYKQINERVNIMIEQGLVQEVETLLPQRYLNALHTVGYRELFDYFDGKVSLNEAITNIQTNTRHYAKRQLTWFKKDSEISWIDPQSTNVLETILSKIP